LIEVLEESPEKWESLSEDIWCTIVPCIVVETRNGEKMAEDAEEYQGTAKQIL
jgi:hypothetical protein